MAAAIVLLGVGCGARKGDPNGNGAPSATQASTTQSSTVPTTPPSGLPPSASASTKRSAQADPMSNMAMAEWPRDQPVINRLLGWQRGIVVQSRAGFHSLDVKGAKAIKFVFAPCRTATVDRVMANAVICTADGKRSLWLRRAGGWHPQALPAALERDEGFYAAAADADTVALMQSERLHLLRAGAWTSHDIGEAPKSPGTMGMPSSLYLDGERLLAAYDRGEWGGGLLQLPLAKPTWKALKQPTGELNIGVHKLVPRPDGGVLAVFGLAHLSLRRGLLVEVGRDALKLIAQNDKPPFPYPKASFQSAAYDSQGVLHVLTGSHGLLALRNGGWQHVTPKWKDSFVYLADVVIQGDTAIIASYDAGIALWPLSGGKPRRVTLPK